MLTRFLGAVATVYGVLGALKALLQTRQMLARRSSRDVSAGFLASYAGGYAIWLAYGLSTGSIPLVVVDTAGLLCGGLTLAVALALRSSLIRATNAKQPSDPLVESLAERHVRDLDWLIVRPAAGSANSGRAPVTG